MSHEVTDSIIVPLYDNRKTRPTVRAFEAEKPPSVEHYDAWVDSESSRNVALVVSKYGLRNKII